MIQFHKAYSGPGMSSRANPLPIESLAASVCACVREREIERDRERECVRERDGEKEVLPEVRIWQNGRKISTGSQVFLSE